jgi:hypothetical protein
LLGYWNFKVADNPSVAPDSSGRGNQGNISIANYTGDGGGKSGNPATRAELCGQRHDDRAAAAHGSI